MSALQEHFAELIRSTLPDGERLELARGWPARIRDHVQQHEFVTEDPHSRLTGSYARRTAVGEIKDVDVIVFVPGSCEDDAPRALLADLEGALKEFPDASLDTTVQRRSVRVTVEGFDVDIVPAIVQGDGHHGVLLVPDKSRGAWIESQPIGYADALSSLNQAHARKVKPQIRLLKLWRDKRMTYMKPKSYWLECLVYHAFDNGSVDGGGTTAGPTFADLLDHLVVRLGPTIENGGVPHIADPMLSNNVASGWEHNHAQALLSRLKEDAALARRAVESEDDEEAIQLWSRVFPGAFPTDATESSKSLSDLLLGAKAAVSPAGVLLSARRPGAIDLPPVRAYGDDDQ